MTRATKKFAYAVIGRGGSIIMYDNISSKRARVIETTIKEFDHLRTHPMFARKWANLTREQFWRKLKRNYGLSVRRISMQVVR